MKKIIFGGFLMAGIAITSIASAQTRTPVVNHREHRQAARINQGVRSGELTRSETHHLRNDEKHIRNQKMAYKSTGHVTAAERARLRREESRTSRAIYRKKHNRRVK
jgi:hypothetical protein